MSDRRLSARLRAQGHDPILATEVGLLSATDARVLSWAIAQSLHGSLSSLNLTTLRILINLPILYLGPHP